MTSMTAYPIELQPHRDHNRAARSLHLLVQVPDDDSAMYVGAIGVSDQIWTQHVNETKETLKARSTRC